MSHFKRLRATSLPIFDCFHGPGSNPLSEITCKNDEEKC